jgi:hypothetical protein
LLAGVDEEEMERLETELPVLIAQSGPLNGKRWVIDQLLLVGRDATCQILITDRQVSRFHARLVPEAQGVMLEDLGSKNGTYWNGDKISERVLLQDGDVIQVALVQNLVFLSSDATVPMEFTPPIQPARSRLYLDLRSRRVWIGTEEVLPPLSAPQFSLLRVLYEQEGKVVPRQEVIETVWGEEKAEGVSEQALDALVRRLRERLTLLDPGHDYIATVRGHGLRLDNPSG